MVEVGDGIEDLTLTLEQLEGVQRVSTHEGNQNRLIIETDRTKDLRAEIAQCIVSLNIDLLELKLVDLSLEDIFMQLVTEEHDRETLPEEDLDEEESPS
jgi:ABC-2 type transport system ATP-binding protein